MDIWLLAIWQKAKGYKAIRIYGKAMTIYNSMATIISIMTHSYMATGLTAIGQ